MQPVSTNQEYPMTLLMFGIGQMSSVNADGELGKYPFVG